MGAGQDSPIKQRDLMLSSGEGVPFRFAIIIRNALPANGPVCGFEIKGADPTGLSQIISHRVDKRDHTTYQDFFARLATDFGLRVPGNQQPPSKPASELRYREVLARNLAPGMIYGYGDPAVLRVEGNGEEPWYYLLATSNDAPDSFPIIRSRNLVDWEFAGYVFPKGQKPGWTKDGEGVSDYWAAEMHLVQNEFRVYFVARHKHTAELCIGVARSPQPDGPFIPDPLPLLTGNRIDPHIFVDEHGASWLYWKDDNNDVWPGLLIEFLRDHPELIQALFPLKEDQVTASFMTTLWPYARMLGPMERFQLIQTFIESVLPAYADFCSELKRLVEDEAEPDCERLQTLLRYMQTPVIAQQLSTNGSTLVGQPTEIIKNDLDWEAHLVEGMWVTKQGGKYYLFYTGNDFSTSQYGIGVAVADSHLGPYTKMERPLLQSTTSWWAPGHPSLVTGPNGKPQILLHAYFPGSAGYRQFRALLAIPVTFNDGIVLTGDTSPDHPQPY